MHFTNMYQHIHDKMKFSMADSYGNDSEIEMSGLSSTAWEVFIINSAQKGKIKIISNCETLFYVI